MNLGPDINSPSFDGRPSFSGDGRIMVFESTRSGNGDLFESRRLSLQKAFGPATVLKHDAKDKLRPAKASPVDGPVAVSFASSDIRADWSPDQGTLLELAEAAGLQPSFACRSGICGTCATRITCGAMDYLEEPTAPHGDDEVLICCATPRPHADEKGCGDDNGVVLDL